VTTIDTVEYRERLEDERARLTHVVDFLVKENPGSMTDELGELAEGGTDNHLGDTASAMYDRELDGRRIEGGTYGVCEVCGEPIGAQRLSAIPWARLCIDDQRRAVG